MNGSEDFSRWRANARGVDLERISSVDYVEYKNESRIKTAARPGTARGCTPNPSPNQAPLAVT